MPIAGHGSFPARRVRAPGLPCVRTQQSHREETRERGERPGVLTRTSSFGTSEHFRSTVPPLDEQRRIVGSNGLVQRLWSYCNVLRDDGLSYGDYLEQLTYLLFLKMADEQTKPPFSRPAIVPEGLDWPSLLERDGDELEVHYRHVLTELGRKPGMLGVVFRKAQNRIQDPAKLRRLIVDLIDRESWLMLDADVKGDAYEGLLEKNAEDVKSGAGQYFTPRPLIRAIVEVMRPEPGMRIADPACGTGGFLLAAHESIAKNHLLDPDEKRALRYEALKGWEIVDNTARLCVMNLLLHGIGDEEHDSPIVVDDALKADPGERFEMVLTNPPFGRKSSMTFVSEEGEVGPGGPRRAARRLLGVDLEQAAQLRPAREDAARDQRPRRGGRPRQRAVRGWRRRDGAAQAARRVRRAHAAAPADRRLLRAGREGERAVLRPQARRGDAVDARAVGLRPAHEPALHAQAEPAAPEHLQDFVDAYKPESRRDRVESERFKRFGYDELIQRDKVSLDLIWLRDDSLEDMDNLPPPEVIAQEIVEDLEAALAEFAAIAASLRGSGRILGPIPVGRWRVWRCGLS